MLSIFSVSKIDCFHFIHEVKVIKVLRTFWLLYNLLRHFFSAICNCLLIYGPAILQVANKSRLTLFSYLREENWFQQRDWQIFPTKIRPICTWVCGYLLCWELVFRFLRLIIFQTGWIISPITKKKGNGHWPKFHCFLALTNSPHIILCVVQNEKGFFLNMGSPFRSSLHSTVAVCNY